MASLYTHKTKNIRKTWFLFSVFLIVIIGIGWIFSRIYGNPIILLIAVVFSSVMSITSYWYSDKLVLKMANAKPATKENNRELYNIVENLAITAGLPMPKLYVVHEPAPNAFATGRDPEHAVVAVTVGLIEKLDRSELEGVIAHELSHIGNRDMLVSTVAVVLVGFISLISDMFMRSLWWGGIGGRRSSNSNGGRAGALMLIIGVALSILAPIAASLMHLAISRKREFLADASGALLTRYPEGLARALEKISADPNPMRVANNTTAHLWLADPFKGKKRKSIMHKMFMSHPPTRARTEALRGMKT